MSKRKESLLILVIEGIHPLLSLTFKAMVATYLYFLMDNWMPNNYIVKLLIVIPAGVHILLELWIKFGREEKA